MLPPGFVREPLGCSDTAHHICGPSAPTGKDLSPFSTAGTVNSEKSCLATEREKKEELN